MRQPVCLPVLPFVLAAGTASTATFLSSFVSALRPYLLGVSVLFIVLGFYQSRRASQCNCKTECAQPSGPVAVGPDRRHLWIRRSYAIPLSTMSSFHNFLGSPPR